MELLRRNHPRVVITGLGAVTPLGPVRELWGNLKAGKSGIRKLQTIDTSHVPVKIGGEVRGFDPDQYMDHKTARHAGRASAFAIAAAGMAIEDAGLSREVIEAEGDHVGVVMGTTLGSFEMTEKNALKYRTGGFRKPNPFSIVSALPCIPAHYISRLFRAFGPINTVSSACASGVQAIGQAYDLIRSGRSDLALAGGVESILKDYTLAGFEAMRALATEYNDNPEEASRPFDAERSGFVLSEGCGVVVIESLSHALQRGAHIYGEILGYGTSSDAYHPAAPDPEGKGAARSMRWALEDSGVNPEDIQYINAHGTSTQQNDAMETKAIKQVFGDYAYKLAVSSTKSMLGHAMAGSGAIEVIVCALSLMEKVITPTINLHTPDPECDLDYVPNTARRMPRLKNIMSNNFGLGGQNASLVLGKI